MRSSAAPGTGAQRRPTECDGRRFRWRRDKVWARRSAGLHASPARPHPPLGSCRSFHFLRSIFPAKRHVPAFPQETALLGVAAWPAVWQGAGRGRRFSNALQAAEQCCRQKFAERNSGHRDGCTWPSRWPRPPVSVRACVCLRVCASVRACARVHGALSTEVQRAPAQPGVAAAASAACSNSRCARAATAAASTNVTSPPP